MSPWLKPRLTFLFCGAAFFMGATYLRALDDYPAPAKTPEEAGVKFYQLLSNFGKDSPSRIPLDGDLRDDAYANIGSVSRAQMKPFFPTSSGRNPDDLFRMVAQVMNAPDYRARITGKQGKQTLVEVSPKIPPPKRELVVIAEDGGYRVDLKATLGRWSHLSGIKLDDQWWHYTGQSTQALTRSSGFLSAQCRSNLRMQMLGMAMYTQDYDEVLPLASHWKDDIEIYVRIEEPRPPSEKPYYVSGRVFTCPRVVTKDTGYAYNQNLDCLAMSRVENSASLISIYETSDLSHNAFGIGTAPAYRHENGSNLAFADGHVKWFKRSDISTLHFKPILSPPSSSSGSDAVHPPIYQNPRTPK